MKFADRYIPKFKLLKELLERQPHTSEYVFPLTEQAIRWALEKLKVLCKFNFCVKDLRHTFATNCYECGIKDTVVAKWLGHGNTQITKQYYVHLMDDFELLQATEISKYIDSHFDSHS